MTPDRPFSGVVALAPTLGSYLVIRSDGMPVSLTRGEAHKTNYRLRCGDRVAFDSYRSRGRYHAFNVRLLSSVGDRKPIRKLPAYYALGPVVHVHGVVSGARR